MAGTISVSSTIAVTLSNSIDNPLTVTDTGTIDITSGIALNLLSPLVWTIDNSGLLQTSGAYVDALKLGAGGSIGNETGGRIVGGAYGAVILGGAGSLTNAGLVQSQGTSGSAITFSAGGVVTNIAGGTISGGHGVEIGSHAGTVTNSGLVNGNSAAVYLNSGTVANLAGGMITSSTTGVQFAGYGFVTNAASATIAATFAVVSGTVGARIDNGGLIIGAPFDGIGVFLGAGGTVSNAPGGTISGYLYGVDIENGARSVINAGMITASHGVAVSTTFGGPGTAYVGNTGSIVGSRGGVRITELPGIVINSGLIDGTSRYGVRLESAATSRTRPGA
jgi:fibronectin-binding autotransporter adhesin